MKRFTISLLALALLVPSSALAIWHGHARPAPRSTCHTYWNGTADVQVGQGCMTTCGGLAGVGGSLDPKTDQPSMDTTGATDTSSLMDTVFAHAVAQSKGIDYTTPGTYLLNLTGTPGTYFTKYGLQPPAGMKIICSARNADGTPAVHLVQTSLPPQDSSIWRFQNGSNTLCGCDLQGPDMTSYSSGSGEGGNFLVLLNGSNNVIKGNTFEGAHGNSAIQINTDYTGVATSGNIMQFNTFRHNSYYAFSAANVLSATYTNNLMFGNSVGWENGSCTNSGQNVTTNVMVKDNELNYETSNAFTGVFGWSGFITGGIVPNTGEGFANNCDYSSNTVSGNMCSGASANLTAHYLSNDSGYLPCQHRAVYSNNYQGANCAWPDSAQACAGHDLGGFLPAPVRPTSTPTPTPTPAPTPTVTPTPTPTPSATPSVVCTGPWRMTLTCGGQ